MTIAFSVACIVLACVVVAYDIYRAGYRAGRRAECAEVAEKCFEEGYRAGYRAHAVVVGLPHHGADAGPFVLGLDLASPSPVDEAERITREACDGD